jgi:hypothetical protein
MGQAIASRNTTWGNVVVKAAQPSADPACDESATSNWIALELPGASLSIRLNPGLVDRLEREVIDSFKSLTERGSEVGGILLGQCETDPRAVFVEDFELVPCGYTRGPLYLLSDAEKRRMEVAVWAPKYRAARTAPVGFFRSNARTGLALENEDISLVDTYFAVPEGVALLIKPFSMKPCLASFFVWKSGPGDRTPDSVQFPFTRSQLPAKRGPAVAVRRVEPPVPALAPAQQEDRPSPPAVTLEMPVPTPPSVEPVTPDVPVIAPAAAPAQPERSEDPVPTRPVVAEAAPESMEELRVSLRAILDPAAQPNPAPPAAAAAIGRENHAEAPVAGVHQSRSGSRLLHWLQLLAAGLVLFIVGAYVQYRLEARFAGPRPSAAAIPSLFLHVERRGGQLYLNWDRNAPPVRAAQKASLFITDGEQTQLVPLSVDELRTGAFVYTPATSGVSFRIELANLPDGRTVSEGIHSVLGRPSPLGALAPPVPSPAPTQEASSTAPPLESAATTQPPAKEEAPPAQPARTPESSATP